MKEGLKDEGGIKKKSSVDCVQANVEYEPRKSGV
jgi:hypothetical protein